MRVVPIRSSEDIRSPIRTCVGCRRRRPRASMRRCVLTASGRVAVDLSESGRGAWLCGAECLETAARRRALARAWRRPMSSELEATAVADLRQQLAEGDPHRRIDADIVEGGDEHAEEHPSS